MALLVCVLGDLGKKGEGSSFLGKRKMGCAFNLSVTVGLICVTSFAQSK